MYKRQAVTVEVVAVTVEVVAVTVEVVAVTVEVVAVTVEVVLIAVAIEVVLVEVVLVAVEVEMFGSVPVKVHWSVPVKFHLSVPVKVHWSVPEIGSGSVVASILHCLYEIHKKVAVVEEFIHEIVVLGLGLLRGLELTLLLRLVLGMKLTLLLRLLLMNLIILAPVRRSAIVRGSAVTTVENPTLVTESLKFSNRDADD